MSDLHNESLPNVALHRRCRCPQPGADESRDIPERDVRDAIAHRDDPIWLEGSTLVDLSIVRELVSANRVGPTCASGRALRAVLIRALADVARDLPGLRVGALAGGLRDGKTQVEIARQIGCRDETLSRLKRILVILVRQRLIAMCETIPIERRLPAR